MPTWLWILVATGLMSLMAWVGLIFLAFRESLLDRCLQVLVAISAGSLLGGAFLHLLPETLSKTNNRLWPFFWLLAGFTVFLLMEQMFHWQHDHRVIPKSGEPVTYLILVADGLHNFLGGLAIGGSFLVSPRVGWITWIVALAHEIPQEFGDFGVLVNGGWDRKKALLLNFMSALTIVPGGLLAYGLEGTVDTLFLLPFAAGNFIYIAASDLIPEIKHSESPRDDLVNFVSFLVGIGLVAFSLFWT